MFLLSQAQLGLTQENFEVSVVQKAERPINPNTIIFGRKLEFLKGALVKLIHSISLMFQIFTIFLGLFNKILCWLDQVYLLEVFNQKLFGNSANTRTTI